MTRFPATPAAQVERSITMQYVGVSADKASTSLKGYVADVTDVQLQSARDAVSDLSNAGLIRFVNQTAQKIAVKDSVVYDEAESSVASKGVLHFMDDDLNEFSINVPAPDASLTEADGVTLDPNNALIIAAINTITAVMNTPVGLGTAGTYAYVRGYIDSGRGAPAIRIVPPISEPGAGDNPPPDPAT